MIIDASLAFWSISAVFVPFPACFYEEMSRKSRLDVHLLTKGFVESRQQAQQLIRAGKVRTISGEILDKPGKEVLHELVVIVEEPSRFVSRGGEKLIAALNAFPISIESRICLDAGISTGGFTDCLLQYGASRVYGVDVGYGQTAWKIRKDTRVVLLERTNIRYLTSEQLYKTDDPWPDLAVADLSFISLRLVLPAIRSLLKKNNSELLLLVKPQFEVCREKVGKGGVVRSFDAHVEALKSVIDFAMTQGWFLKGIIASPITGAAGNHEYLLWLGLEDKGYKPFIESLVRDTLSLDR